MTMKKEKLVTNDQLVNFYYYPGKKQSLVFLHGWRSEAKVWFNIAQTLNDEGFNVYLIDLPGFGESPVPHYPFGVSDYAKIVVQFIDKIGINKPIIIGHSFGGRIAIKLSSTYPDSVDKLILTGAAGLVTQKNKIAIMAKMARLVKPLFKHRPLSSFRSKIYKMIGSEDYVMTPELKETYVKIVNEDLRPDLSKITAPTLLIWGEKDTETPVEYERIMREEIKNSNSVILDGAGHFAFIDKPREFLSSLNKFIK